MDERPRLPMVMQQRLRAQSVGLCHVPVQRVCPRGSLAPLALQKQVCQGVPVPKALDVLRSALREDRAWKRVVERGIREQIVEGRGIALHQLEDLDRLAKLLDAKVLPDIGNL